MRNQFFATALIIAAPLLLASSAAPLTFASGSKVWLEGTSTVRGFRCESARVTGTAEAGGTELSQVGQARGEIVIPVQTLECGNATMNGHMRNALKMQQNPNIRFHATSVRVTPSSGAQGTVAMTGHLTIAGQTRDVTINGTAAREGNTLRVRGSERITMTDYGVQPPRLMAGTMRVHPPVTVGFDVVLKP
jgi:polyisoprenoid-binding protein YceI